MLRRSFLPVLFTPALSRAQFSPKPAYPPSTALGEMVLDWSTHKRDAPGSDNWQLTWADDGHLYGAWGDGGGFGGSNSDGRVSLGYGRLEGDWTSCRGVNVWGGKNALSQATFQGKSWGTVCVAGILYMWVVPKSLLAEMQSEARLYSSADHGRTWTPASWAFQRADDLTIPTICQFGRNNQGARDRFVYHYFIAPRDSAGYNIQTPGAIHLARSPAGKLMERSDYEFFSHLRRNEPVWTQALTRKRPVFEDRENGVGWVSSVCYNAGRKRYILMVEHTASSRGNLGVYDAPEPWGPWTTVHFSSESAGTPFGAGQPNVPANTFFWNLPTKWHSSNGLEFTMVFTGAGRGKDNDSLNLVRGTFSVPDKRR
ncbi:MAG: DUF4185 domain-containing protein [Bryobacteraceae bacterium]|nr:DUF4185 domain-containing protein [Bryobacteraceae bacterium]